MSSKDSEASTVFIKEDIEPTELTRRSEDYSESATSSEMKDSRRWPTAQSQTEFSEDEANGSAITFLNTSDENHNVFGINRMSSRSLEDASSGDLIRTNRFSVEKQSNLLTRKAPSMKGSLSRSASPNSLDRPCNKSASPLDSLERPSTRNASPLDSVERPSTRSASPRDSVERPSTRNASPRGSVERPSTRNASPLGSVERPSTRNASPLGTVERSSTRSAFLPNALQGHPCESAFLNPLEGPSTRTVRFSDSEEGSLSRFYQSYHSVTEINEYFNNTPPSEQNGYWFRTRTWLASFLIRYSRQIRHSAYFPLFKVTLLALPCSAGYMSLKYRNLCRGCPRLPYLMYLFAIFGMFIMIIRILADLFQRYFAPDLTGRNCDGRHFSCEPNFIHPGSEDFCIKVFYDYAYQVNIVVSVVILLMCLINIPALYDESETE